MEQLPTYSNNKRQGNLASDILKKNLGKFSVVNVIDEAIDLGIDMRAQIIENCKPVPLFFNVQCKGKEDLSSDCVRESHFSIPIKISTINYWRQQNDITILFVVDNKTERCYWCEPLKQIYNQIEDIQYQKTIQINVPLEEYIDTSYDHCPKKLINSILLFMVDQLKNVNKYMDGFNDEILSNYKLDIETSVYLLKQLNENAKGIIKSYQLTCENIMENIKLQIKESFNYAIQLEQLDPMIVSRYCKNGIRDEKGFTSNHKSLEELKKESETIIEDFLANQSKTDILDDLVVCDMETEDLLRNIGGFLYEMACEDNPLGDHSKLYEMTWEHRWKYYNNMM